MAQTVSHIQNIILAPLAAAALGLLGACGTDNSSASLQDTPSGNPLKELRTLSFTEWCTEWKLTCPTGTPVDFPVPGKPWNAEQWRQLLLVAQDFSESQSSIVFSRNDLTDKNMTLIAQAMNLQTEVEKIRAHMDTNSWKSLTLGQGQPIVATFETAGSSTLAAGLTLNHEVQVQALLTSGVVTVSGATMSSQATGTSESLSGIRVESPNRLELAGQTTAMSQVPMDFFLEQLLGTPVTPPTTPPDLAQTLRVVAPLRALLVSNERKIHLESRFFSTLAAAAPYLIDLSWHPEMPKSIQTMLTSIERADSGWDSGAKDLLRAQLKPTKRLKCRIEGAPVVLEIAKEFGLTDFGNTETGAAFVEMFGIRTKIDLPGPLDPAFNITRMEFTDKKITIKNVPVIGEYSMKLPQNNDPTDPAQQTAQAILCSN
jgi:hypothetical protein